MDKYLNMWNTDTMLKINSLMPHRPHEFPVSRDWQDLDCGASQCKWNDKFLKKCKVPSLAVIGDDGRCKGFKLDCQPTAEGTRKIRME